MRRLLTILFAGLAGVILAVLGHGVASAAGGTISGTVTDAQTGNPVSGVNVYVYTTDYEYASYAYTGQNGQFTTTSALPPGDYKIQYMAPYQSTYLNEWYDDKASFDSADPITIDAANITADASLTKGARFTGKLTAVGSGEPIVSASVTVYSADTYSSVSYGSTDQNGQFTTGALYPGDYKIQYAAPSQSAYLGEWYDNKSSYAAANQLTIGATDVTADASLVKGARFTGTVTAEDTGNPLANASVYVYSGGSFLSQGYASTDQNGQFTTGALPPGSYTIQYNAPYQSSYLDEWYNDKSNYASADPVTLNSTDKAVDAALTRGSRVVGTVTDPQGQPVSNVSVYVESDDDYGWANTDSNGRYTSSAVQAGEYRIRFRPGGTTYLEEWFDNKPTYSEADPVTLTKGQDTPIDIALDKASHIVGTVTDPQGNPVLAEVRAYSGGNFFTDTTGGDGTYDIGGLREGSYTLRITPVEPSGLAREWWNNQVDQWDADPITLGGDATFTANVELADGGVITGTVLDDQDNPVEAVTVRATGAESEKTLTAADGTYRLVGLEKGGYRVRFKPQGNLAVQWYDGADSETDATELAVSAGQTLPDIDAHLRQARTITGTVTDPQGQPVEDVRVEVYKDGTFYYVDRAWTDATGTFATSDLPTGTYRVYLRPSSPTTLASQWYDKSPSRSAATPVTVIDGQATIIDAELEEGGSISGKVAGSGGTPLANAYVQAGRDKDYRYAVTNANGDYTITGLSTGEYAVEFSSGTSAYVSEWYDDKDSEQDANPVSVVAGQQKQGINAQLTEAGSISGTLKTSDGQALTYADVSLYLGNDPVEWTWTGLDGSFTFTGLRPGTYTMRASGYGEWLTQWWNGKPTQASADLIPVAAGADLTGKDFTLQRGASIAGTVTGAGGTPVDGSVEVTDAAGEELGWAEIDNGSYKVLGLPSGTYYAHFRSYGGDWLPQWWNNKQSLQEATPITVTDGQALTGINAVLAKGASIRGTILNGKGNPVPACVRVYAGLSDDDAGSACTNDAGEYIVGGLTAGSYQILFDPYSGDYARQWWDGQARRATAWSLSLGQATQEVANATLLKGGTLTGVVTDEQGDPVGGVEVRAYTGPDDYSRTAVTDGRGRYTMMGLDDEDYRLQAVPGSSRLDLVPEWFDDKSGYASADVVSVANGGIATAGFELEKGATVSGTVTDDKDRPVAGIGVDVFDLNGNKSLTVWTDPTGHYTSTALKADTYKVRFMPGYYGGEGLVEQWWNDKPTLDTANVVQLSAKEQKTGIDAKLKPIGSATAPGVPTAVVATPGDEKVTLTWEAPSNNGGLAITRYYVEGTPYGECETLGQRSCTIEGLDNGLSFTFTVRAANSAGSSPPSAPSGVAVPFGKPMPPTGVKAAPGQESASVSWTPGSDNGRPILEYVVTSTPGGNGCSTSGTSCTVSGLTGGTAYTFTVKARNLAGESTASQPSQPVTPSSAPVQPPVQPPVSPVPPTGGVTPPGPVPASPQRPAAPTKLRVSVKKRKASASWAKVPSATSYEVRVSPAKGKKGSWKRTSKPSFTSGKLKKGSYRVEVRAVGAAGVGPIASNRFKVA